MTSLPATFKPTLTTTDPMNRPHEAQLQDILQALSRIEEAVENARDAVEDYQERDAWDRDGLDLEGEISEIEGGLLDLREVAP